ncbi:hypothetical protein TD95_001104 [Thielaviopsis punctulata]|uniref:ENTH domain-containing protein n=1 Tax=Thielaviopsis punctulata TaxID=72032 RepID=A0A0F4ZK51_9PEZI|nr:hypothetical protein TD95_001104 [Thielaviopsis punctulata]
MSSSFEKSVKGATKIKAAPPKTKYIEHILIATHSGEAGVGEVFRTLAVRLRETTWTVVIKSLITIHFMVRDGQQDITLAYLARHRNILAISAYTDAGAAAQPHGYTIRKYAEYLSERARSYRETKCDWVRSKEDRLEKLSVEKGLLRETESVQDQLQALLQCEVMNDEHDEITTTVFRFLVMDLLALFQAVNLGMINILGHFFEMSKPDAERALDIYRRFVEQTDFVVAYLSVARQYEHMTRVEVPELKHAPVHLTGQLQDYLKDPDFEIHRRQYIAEQAAKKKFKTSGTNSAPPRSPETAAIPERPKTSSGPSAPPASQAVPPMPTIGKGPDQNLIDLFDDLEQNQTVQTIGVPQMQMAQAGFQPQATGFMPGVAPQQTAGYNLNPFQMQGAFGAPAQAPMPTGAGFGGFTPQPQGQPQAVGMQPTGFQQAPQMTGMPFGQPQMAPQPMMQQSPQPMMHPSSQQQPQALVPTATGTNPFRQSMMPPSSPKSKNPFARASTNQTGLSPNFGAAPQQLVPTATGSTNPFAKQPSMLSPQPTATSTGLVPQTTGSTNPFRQSMMPQSTGWQQNQTIGGGLDQVPVVPVFPRQGQPGQQWPQ